jgi:lysophospholipase L1-like esterase
MKNGRAKLLLAFILSGLWSAAGRISLGSPGSGRDRGLLGKHEVRLAYRLVEGQVPVSPESTSLPVVKENASGETWAAWEEWAPGGSRVGVGFLRDDGVLVRRLSPNPEGSDYSPDLAFDPAGSPWASWARYSGRGCRILVHSAALKKTWSLRPSPKAAVTQPRLAIDGTGVVRVFWNESEENRWRIVARTWSLDGWSPRNEVCLESTTPAVSPAVVSSRQGSTWLAWSGYDGHDFEVFFSRWSGGALSPPLQLTRNEENDLFPALGIGRDDLPVLSWLKSREQEDRIFAARYDGQQFGRATPVSPRVRGLLPPRAASAAGDSVVVWKSDSGLDALQVTADPIPPDGPASEPAHQPPSVFNPDRDENCYLGFGDSITYGYIDRLPTPELGYPPRLDIILDRNFGPTEMINEGLGGENTLLGVVRIDAVLASRPGRYILIMEGTNDVINKNLSIDTSVFCLREMARKARAAGVFPTMATIPPRRDWAWPDPQIRARQLYLNEQIRKFPVELLVSFIDMDELFLDYPLEDGGMLSLLSHDLKHPSEKGYQFMAEKWFAEIKNYPFPPVALGFGVQYRTEEAPGSPSRKTTRPPLRLPRTDWGPVVSVFSWQPNPKIFDPGRVEAYKIYYRKKNLPEAPYRVFALVEDTSILMDAGILALDDCLFLVAALRDDDVEGPCAGPVEN